MNEENKAIDVGKLRIKAKMTCWHCRFVHMADVDSDGARIMQCRRYAPRALVHDLIDPKEDPLPSTLWPDVNGYDWCGEWQGRYGLFVDEG